MKKWYFAYGMNTNLREMARRCPDAVCHGAVVLQDHKFVFRRHADIEYSPGHHCEGVLWEITDPCEQALDFLEGYPHYYDKKDVIVESRQAVNGMTKFVAMTYYMTEQKSMHLPGDIYLTCVREGYRDNGLNDYQINQALTECQQKN
jgi:hypothetical protein